MVKDPARELPHVGEALASVRAAIDVVAAGTATRVVVHALACEQILRASMALARAAGVALEPQWWADDAGCDIVVTRADGTPRRSDLGGG